MTYADAPNSSGLFKHGGDYKKGMAMTPEGAAISLSGQFNAAWICDAISVAMSEPPASAAQKRAENPMLTQIKALLGNSDGNGSVFLTSIQGVVGGMMNRGGPAIGFVMDIKDRDKALKSLEAIAKLAGEIGRASCRERV